MNFSLSLSLSLSLSHTHTHTHFKITLGPLFLDDTKATLDRNKKPWLILCVSLYSKTRRWCWLRVVLTVTYKSFSEKDSFITAKGKCQWYQEKGFPRELETKANHSCDSYFQKCSEEYRFVLCGNHVTNHNNMNIIFMILSANIEVAHLVIAG